MTEREVQRHTESKRDTQRDRSETPGYTEMDMDTVEIEIESETK